MQTARFRAQRLSSAGVQFITLLGICAICLSLLARQCLFVLGAINTMRGCDKDPHCWTRLNFEELLLAACADSADIWLKEVKNAHLLGAVSALVTANHALVVIMNPILDEPRTPQKSTTAQADNSTPPHLLRPWGVVDYSRDEYHAVQLQRPQRFTVNCCGLANPKRDGDTSLAHIF